MQTRHDWPPQLSPLNGMGIAGLQDDSRAVNPGDIFIALEGETVDARRFIPDALKQGAKAVIQSGEQYHIAYEGHVPLITVPELNWYAGELASHFYDHPSRHASVIGITGTNGKTSVSHFIQQTLNSCGHPAGVLGTLGYGANGSLHALKHTTPSAVKLQQALKAVYDQGSRFIAMEVSSHSLVQGRVEGVQFDTAVLTNLSREHLDYHHTMEAYARAKQQLFRWSSLKTAVINFDDPYFSFMASPLHQEVERWSYSRLSSQADVYAKAYTCHSSGLEIQIVTPAGNFTTRPQIAGHFNVSNILACCAYLCSQRLDIDLIRQALDKLQSVPGRMEAYVHSGRPLVIIDYAHTPEALELALQAARDHCSGRLLCVFGCGGERDRGKRPLMAAAAERYCDEVWLTDDNPRGESSAVIINDILTGSVNNSLFQVEHDRARAVDAALASCGPEDTVLIAGKGHENYQIYADRTEYYSDRDLISRLLS